MFTIVGIINYIFKVEKFYGFFKLLLTFLDASLGNYDFSIFDEKRYFTLGDYQHKFGGIDSLPPRKTC